VLGAVHGVSETVVHIFRYKSLDLAAHENLAVNDLFYVLHARVVRCTVATIVYEVGTTTAHTGWLRLPQLLDYF